MPSPYPQEITEDENDLGFALMRIEDLHHCQFGTPTPLVVACKIDESCYVFKERQEDGSLYYKMRIFGKHRDIPQMQPNWIIISSTIYNDAGQTVQAAKVGTEEPSQCIWVEPVPFPGVEEA